MKIESGKTKSVKAESVKTEPVKKEPNMTKSKMTKFYVNSETFNQIFLDKVFQRLISRSFYTQLTAGCTLDAAFSGLVLSDSVFPQTSFS